jgi:L-asparaginase
VRLLAVGGTISCLPGEGLAGVAAELTAADIAESVPGLGDVAELEVGDVATVASFAITVGDLLALALATRRAFAEGCDGVVITHGSDTIEETAYALALMLPRERPIVLTGAMRNPTLPGTDGPANLLAATRVAATPETGELGPVVVFGDELHSARFVTKLHTTRVTAFASPAAGPVGDVVERRVHRWFLPAYDDLLGLPASLDEHRVELVQMVADPSDATLRAAVERWPAGVVVVGTGGGHLPPTLLPVLDDVRAAGIPVVMASRCASGRTLEETYGMPGGETDLRSRGVLMAGLLSGPKARLRLLVGLALGRDPATLFPV